VRENRIRKNSTRNLKRRPEFNRRLIPVVSFSLDVARRINSGCDSLQGLCKRVWLPNEKGLAVFGNYEELVAGFEAQSPSGFTRDRDSVF